VRYVGTPDARPGGARTNRQSLGQQLIDKIMALVAEDGVNTLLLPVNFGNTHLCGMLIDVSEKAILVYDSLNQDLYVATLKALARSVNLNFKLTLVETPLQFDGYNRGVFVCYFFYNHVNPSKAVDMNTSSLTLRRWQLLYFALTGNEP
jgi:Ulp1 family protease